MRYNPDSVKMASENAASFHVADFDGVWDSLPHIRMIAGAVVTGRSYQEAAQTYREIQQGQFFRGLRVPIYFNPVKMGVPNLDNISSWKAEMIKKLNATDFWEDDPEQARNIEAMCPGVTVHLVNSSHAKGN